MTNLYRSRNTVPIESSNKNQVATITKITKRNVIIEKLTIKGKVFLQEETFQKSSANNVT